MVMADAHVRHSRANPQSCAKRDWWHLITIWADYEADECVQHSASAAQLRCLGLTLIIWKEAAMKQRSLAAAATMAFVSLLVTGFAANGAEIKVLSALAMVPVMEDLGPSFERT